MSKKRSISKMIKEASRERELEERRTHGDPYSRNSAGIMEKNKKEKRRLRRRENKKISTEDY